MDYLIFIDTNIFLDFYRIRNSDAKLEYLKLIDKHLDSIITSSQVEMEYKKNRQSVILETIKNFKQPDWKNLEVPAILEDSDPNHVILRNKAEIIKQQKKISQRIDKILKDPISNDIVYKSLQKLFKNKSKHNLNRTNEIRFKIRNLAKKRFILGYPPRKKEDNSIGDAINWEWIIKCAEESKKHIIIVSRDNDFGLHYDGASFLNDWLLQEFKERVSLRRQIILTNRLAVAFKTAAIQISKKTVEAEENLLLQQIQPPQLNKNKNYNQMQDLDKQLDELLSRITNIINKNEENQ